jgi:hypothetical protein
VSLLSLSSDTIILDARSSYNSFIMRNLLVISLGGSAAGRQMYPQLSSKALSRAVVHESLTGEDALNFIGAGWPSVIFLSDASITNEENRDVLLAAANWVKEGCTMICMAFFSSTIEYDVLDSMFKEQFGLKWRVAEYTLHDVRLHQTFEQTMIRTPSLVPDFRAKAVYLGHVPAGEVVYDGGSPNLAYAAFARVGLGKLGYVGDVNFGEEPERLIMAMCHLDQPEDSMEL